jgi:hypothetical protein
MSMQAVRDKGVDQMAKNAEKMVNRTNQNLKSDRIEIGCNVVVPVPEFDRSKTDAANIAGVVWAIEDDGGVRIRTVHGGLEGILHSNQFSVMPERLIRLADTKAMPKLSIRTAARAESIVGGQGRLPDGIQ